MDQITRMKELVEGHASTRVSDALNMLESAIRLQVEVKQFEREHTQARETGYAEGLNNGIDLVENFFVHPIMKEVNRLRSPSYVVTDGDVEQFIRLCRDCAERLTSEIKAAAIRAEVPKD